MRKNVSVAAAMIWKEGKLLICQRGAGGSCAFLWEFPGGKVECGETALDCVIRECKEELDIIIDVKKMIAQFDYDYPDKQISFTFFDAEILSGTVQKQVHGEIRWVSPEELDSKSFCPADIEIVEQIKNQGRLS